MTHYKITAQKLKETINPSDFYMREQNLHRFEHKSGQWALAGLCPFHKDSSSGSFKINLQNGAFKCFSCDEKGGDILAFSMKKHEISFPEALRKIGNDWGFGC